MDRFNVVANTVRVRLAGLAERLYCAHRRTTFPMTLRASVSVGGRQSAQSETYMACLECGRHFAYDWTTMRIARRRVAWVATPALLPALGEANRASR
jgi:RNase P subunit RPR2